MPTPGSKQQLISANTAFVERRFLLFQLDYSNPFIQEYLGYNPFTRQSDSSYAKTPFKFLDPLEYEDTSSPLYWRNILDPKYYDTYRDTLKKFRDDFFTLVNDRAFSLRPTGAFPFRDISPFVKNLNNYSVALSGFSNSITMDLSDPENLSSFGVTSPDGNTEGAVDLLNSLDIKENDVLMVRVSRDGGKSFEMEYLGFVTQIKNGSKYGTISDMGISVEGVSKSFYTTSIIKQGAVNPNQFIVGVEVSDTTTPSVFENNFNSLNTGQIFSSILKSVLGIKKLNVSPSDAQENLSEYLYDTNLFNGKDNLGFQSNIFLLLTMYLMQGYLVDLKNGELNKLFPKAATNSFGVILDTPVRAYLQHGEHKTYNLMIAEGFQNFYAQLATPNDVFGESRANSFYEIFEMRNGTLVCRPPRYNKIEVTDSDISSSNVDETSFGAGVDQIFTFVPSSAVGGPTKGKYVFNKNADFFINKEDQAESIEIDKNDMQLDSRADTQFVLPTVAGAVEYPAGSYTDPGLLVKYGLRAKGPVNNPNVLNPNLAKLYAPIVLGINNAETRSTSAILWDTTDYRIGKLYYIESENIVIYTISSTIEHVYGQLGKNTIQSVMIRHVIDRPISEILLDDNELLNFAMCYLPDIVADPKATAQTPSKSKATLISRAKSLLTTMGQQASTVPMFRYVPSILDLIVDVEADPSLAAKESNSKNTKDRAAVGAASRKNGIKEAIHIQDQFYAMGLDRAYGTATFMGIESAISSGRPDKNLQSILPGVGVYQYNKSTAGASVHASQSLGIFTTKEADTAISVPVYTPQISADPEAFLFSQYLIDRLALMDLAMKYSSDGGNALRANELGFPQFYGPVECSGIKAYRLFGSSDAPQDYLAGSFLIGRVAGLTGNIFLTPNALKFEPLTGSASFVNGFFRIRGVNGNNFRLPPGHFIHTELDSNGNKKLVFHAIPGGRYNVDQASPSQPTYLVNPLGKGNYVVEDIAATTWLANIPTDIPGTPITDGAMTVPAQSTLALASITAPDGLYFISPFTDMSLERMLEFGLTPALAGYRKDSQVASLIKGTTNPLLADNDLHSKGQALDLCPEMLTRGSGSDLEVLPGLFDRMTKFMEAAGFHRDDISSLLPITKDSVKITWTYQDNTPAGGITSPAQVYYHLGITDKEVKLALNKLIAVSGGTSGV